MRLPAIRSWFRRRRDLRSAPPAIPEVAQVIPSSERVSIVLEGGEKVVLDPDERVRYVTNNLISTTRAPKD